MSDISKLAINGGEPVIKNPMPPRKHFGIEEKNAAMAMFDAAISSGTPFGYSGEQETEFCKEFADAYGGGYADGVNSGTNAVFVALRAINPEPFTEIIVGSVTDAGGIMPIVLCNCIPVIADVAPGTYNTSAEEIEKVITPLTSVIIVPHIGGEPADMPRIMELAKKHKIPVIEDCSQTHGAEINGRRVGSFGDIAAFSLMFGKHICTGGQGGMVFTRNEELYWKIRRAADRGKPYNIENSKGNVFAALNCNMSELEAAIGRAQLKKLDDIIARRTKVAKLIGKKMADSKTVVVPELPDGVKHSYWWWRLKINLDALPARDKFAFLAAVIAEGVVMMDDYSFAIPSTFDWFTKRCAFGSSHYPWSAREYKGDANRQFPILNTKRTMSEHFNLIILESWGEAEANVIAEAFLKVENNMCKGGKK